MNYFVSVNGKMLEIELVENGSSFDISVNGKTVSANLQAQEGSCSLLHGFDSHTVSVDETAKGLLLGIDGKLFQVSVLSELEKRIQDMAPKSKKQNGQVVESEMPGVVKKVFVAEGEVVKMGDGLLVLEAMKMENLIRAEQDGTVRAVHVQAGDQVAVQQTLLRID